MLKFDCTTVAGEPVIIHTRGSDEFQRRLQSPESTSEQKSQAKEALQWLASEVERTANMPQLDQAAWRMVWELDLQGLAYGWSKIVTTEKNGVSRRTIEPM